MNNPVFIFARGGSKGIKNKNIKLINNKPLISYTIEFALKNKQLGKIFISTDDEKISKIVKKYPVEVIKRPKRISRDNSKEIEAWRHAANYLKRQGLIFDKMIILPVTSPLKKNVDIHKALRKFTKNTDFIISITKSNRHPEFNMVRVQGDFANLAVSNKKKFFNRQNTSAIFDMTTILYIVRTSSLFKYNHLFDGKVKYVEIPKNRSIDIDDHFDLKIAALLLKNENSYKI